MLLTVSISDFNIAIFIGVAFDKKDKLQIRQELSVVPRSHLCKILCVAKAFMKMA